MHSHTIGCLIKALGHRARLVWHRLRGRKVSTVDIHVEMTDGRTTEDAITIAVTIIGEALKDAGTDILEGNTAHHEHTYGDTRFHHAVWVHDNYRAKLADAL